VPSTPPAGWMFATNLDGCKSLKIPTWCFTADGHIYFSPCNPGCTRFSPMTMSVTGTAQ
jgi:hypothetical protein